MAVALEFYNFLVPIATIEQKYPGGWERCLKDHESNWYDEYLFRLGAMNCMDIQGILDKWEKMGFTLTEKKNGHEVWKDVCVLGLYTEYSLAEWLAVDPEKRCAYLKGTDPNGLIHGKDGFLYPEDLRVIGAMIGDIAGSGYEWHNIKHKPERLIRGGDKFTDDTVLTYAVATGIIDGMKKVDRSIWMADEAMQSAVEMEIARSLKRFARKYPNAGYGSRFRNWCNSGAFEPYDSWGNGSAMRASFAGWYADSLEEAELLGRVSARFTHGHPEGIKGAVAVAGSIYLLRTGHDKEEVREYVSRYYDLNFTLDDIRGSYRFDESCAGSVPQAFAAFFENDSFEEVIKAAISIGGDSDTIAAIAGSIAEAYYPAPVDLTLRAWDKLDSGMKFAARTVTEFLRQNHSKDFIREDAADE